MFASLRFRCLALAAAMVAAVPLAMAQGGHGGGGPQGGGGMGRGSFGGGNIPLARNLRSVPPPASRGEISSTMRGGLQLGPPGRWWDDKMFAQSLGLDSSQQHRMDDAFNASKPALVKLYKTLQHEESQLEKLTKGKNPDEGQIFQQIDRVTQAKGEVEKVYAHMELAIRKEMTDDQIARLDDRRVPVE